MIIFDHDINVFDDVMETVSIIEEIMTKNDFPPNNIYDDDLTIHSIEIPLFRTSQKSGKILYRSYLLGKSDRYESPISFKLSSNDFIDSLFIDVYEHLTYMDFSNRVEYKDTFFNVPSRFKAIINRKTKEILDWQAVYVYNGVNLDNFSSWFEQRNIDHHQSIDEETFFLFCLENNINFNNKTRR